MVRRVGTPGTASRAITPLFDTWGERSVPLIAHRTMQGGIAHRVGDIADLGAWLRELGDE